MAVNEWTVVYDMQLEGAGSEATKAGTSVLKGELIPPKEYVKGLTAGVCTGKLVTVKAEGAEEAIQIAGEQYGNRGGVGGAALTSNFTFASK